MELPKRTKIAGGVLVLALVALGVDRMTGGPEAADAAADPAGNTPLPAASAKPAAPTEAPAQSRGALADRLNQLRPVLPGENTRLDAFAAPPEWFPAPVHQPITEPAKSLVQKPTFHLTAVVRVGGPIVAVIDKNRLMVGGTPGSMVYPSEFQVKNTDGSTSTIRLVRADEKHGSAVIDVDGKEMELTVETGLHQNARSDESSGK